jgi:iron complex outermembrane recepter protein
MKKIRRNALSVALINAFGASVLLVAGDAAAQQAQRVEKIEVTGTNIKRTDTETPSVVQVITREQIERSGAASVAELLREVPAIAGGSLQDFDRGTGFSPGQATVALRGLGSVATLVLLNGRRIAAAPVADPNAGQGSAFNVNTIPLSAIERIDILKDGASAIYGSEAIAGVVNIILRKDYRGAELSWSHWQKLDQFEDMNYRTEQISGAIGFGDIARDRYNVLAAVDFFKRDPQRLQESGSGVRNDDYRRLAARDVPLGSAFTSPPNFRREGTPGSGVFNTRLPVDPRCPVDSRVTIAGTTQVECRINQFQFIDLISETERAGIMGRATYQLTPNITAFAEAGWSKTESTTKSSPATLGDTPATWFNRAGQRFSYTLVLPVGHPDNPANVPVGLRYRFLDLGPSISKTEQEVSRVVAGLNGTFGAWDWETGVIFEKNEISNRQNSFLHFPTLLAAINSGTYRFGGTNPQSLLDSLHPSAGSDGESKVTGWDLRVSRELMQLRTGPVGLAAGVEARREEMNIVSDPRLVAGEFINVASTGMSGERTVWSVFGELSIPVLKNLEAQLAARHDHYSDFGNATTPKVGLKWNATDTLAARATYARGFRAPSLFQISTAQVQAFVTVADPLRCVDGVPVPGGEALDCARSTSALISANSSVQPEKSTSNTVGFIWSPNSNHSLSIDRWYVHRMDFIDIFDITTVLRNEGNPNFQGGSVIRNPNPATWLPGVPNSGPLQSILVGFGNFGDQAIQGYDLDARAKVPLGAWGRLNLEANLTYYDKVLWQLSTPNPNYISGNGNFFFYSAPRVRSQLTATWDTGPWSILGRYNYVGGWYYGEPTSVDDQGNLISGPLSCYLGSTSATLAFLGRCYVEAFETWDAGVTWTGFKNLKVGVLVRNLTNKAAPYDPNQTTRGFNPTFHNPYGRYLQFNVSYKFK